MSDIHELAKYPRAREREIRIIGYARGRPKISNMVIGLSGE